MSSPSPRPSIVVTGADLAPQAVALLEKYDIVYAGKTPDEESLVRLCAEKQPVALLVRYGKIPARVMDASRAVGRAIQQAFQPTKVGATIVGIEVPHVHVHLVPIDGLQDLDFSRADKNPKPEAMDAAADAIRRALRELGYAEVAS